MGRTKTIFFGFTGPEINNDTKIFKLQDGYELWNLKKHTIDEFIDILKANIQPVNNNVIHNYKFDNETRNPYGITAEQYERCSWGLLIPDTLEEGGFSYTEALFLLNLYSPNFLYPIFVANDMGITRQKYKKDPMVYFHDQNYKIFNHNNFIVFYKTLFKQSQYGNWNLYHTQTWDKEDWRLFIAVHLYSGLTDYENEKSSFGWQRESAEMVTILEAMFTAGDTHNEEVMYRLRKRMAALLAWKFPNIEKDIRELYSTRSAFVHGSFFEQIAKESPAAYNHLPIPNFDILYKHKEYVRFALVAYINLARVIKLGGLQEIKSTIDALEQGIINLDLRQKLIEETKRIFELMPEPTIQMV